MLVLLLLTACQTEPQVAVFPREIRLSDSSSVPSTKQPPVGPIGTVANVRQAETVKVYGVNRYVDPVDPRILHERHAIYRVEQQPSWVTRSNTRQGEILLGPILGLHRPEYSPEPLPGETARDLAETKRGLQNIAGDLRVMREGQEKLANNVQSLAEQTLESQRKLTGTLGLLNERIKRLEGQGEAHPTPAANTSAVRTENGGVVVRPGE